MASHHVYHWPPNPTLRTQHAFPPAASRHPAGQHNGLLSDLHRHPYEYFIEANYSTSNILRDDFQLIIILKVRLNIVESDEDLMDQKVADEIREDQWLQIIYNIYFVIFAFYFI